MQEKQVALYQTPVVLMYDQYWYKASQGIFKSFYEAKINIPLIKYAETMFIFFYIFGNIVS